MPSVRAVAALKHPKLPLLAATSIRCGSVFSCKPSCEVRAGQCRRSPWRGTGRQWGGGEVLVGYQEAPGLGDQEHLCLGFSKGAAHPWQSSCCPRGWGPRASHPIASTPQHKPSCFCSAAHCCCKAEGMT